MKLRKRVRFHFFRTVVLLLFYVENKTKVKGGVIQVHGYDPKVTQPCLPSDSCKDRCGKDAETRSVIDSYMRFNCYCDHACKKYGDCCWDYESECLETNEFPTESQIQDKSTSGQESIYECVVIDQFSRGSYWMVTDCAEEWEDNEIAEMCHNTEATGYEYHLPVQSDTGFTYRNVFCAQCNFVENHLYWSFQATCIRSAPEEVLSGNPEMLSYYLEHFCTLKLVKQNMFSDLEKDWSEWKRSLRPCVLNLVDDCPSNYNNHTITKLCRSYQSIVLSKDLEETRVFKNPFCAFCHGIITDIETEKPIVASASETSNSSDSYNLTCPMWLRNSYYDNLFWKLDTSVHSNSVFSTFNKNYKTSYWVPPSFSVLISFNDGAEITYQEDSSPSVLIPKQESCMADQIYDPFFGVCRIVECSGGMLFVNGKCVSKTNEAKTTSPETQEPFQPSSQVATVTISVVLPPLSTNNTYQLSSQEISEELVAAYEKVLNTTSNSSINIQTTEFWASNGSLTEDREADDSNLEFSVSFFLMEIGKYSEDDIIKIVESIIETVSFEQLIMEMDSYKILVVEHSYPKNYLVCQNEQMKMQYSNSEYLLTESDDKKTLWVNETNLHYNEDQFQLLDWVVTINEDGITSMHMEESRAVVCFQNETNFGEVNSSCSMYAPLNASEYLVFENNSLFLKERNILLPPEEYISTGDGYAVCLDGITFDSEYNENASYATMSSTDVIISWVTFGLTLLSLLSLIFTFFTYCLFSDLRTQSGCCIMNLTAALFTALLVFSFGANLTKPPALCTSIAIILHYFYLTTFFWNNIMAFDVWRTFGNGIKQTFRVSMLGQASAKNRSQLIRVSVFKYMCYGWGMPLIVVLVCLIIEFGFSDIDFGYIHRPGDVFCWISNPLANILAFGLPMGLILISNVFFFVLSIKSIHRITSKIRHHSNSTSVPQKKSNRFTWKSRKVNKNQQQEKSINVATLNTYQKSAVKTTSSLSSARVNVFVYIKMSTVMGFTWSVGFLSAVMPQIAFLRYIFEILVPMQGIFIFAAFICKKRVWKLYERALKKKGKRIDSKLPAAIETSNNKTQTRDQGAGRTVRFNQRTLSSSSWDTFGSRSCSESTQDDTL